jgi:adenosylcobinamide kinase/adenosylcobinamide-phosphate guanylyltransferase
MTHAPTHAPGPSAELILGGQRSGKSRRAEQLARDWLDGGAGRRAVLVATGQAHDDEMRERIERHRAERARRVPQMLTVEAPDALAEAIGAHTAPDIFVVVDCLTLWLTQRLMPMQGPAPTDTEGAIERLAQAVQSARGPLVLVGNEIGLGVIPMGRETRAFVDALGALNQRMAQVCARVTFMAAGLPLALKGAG